MWVQGEGWGVDRLANLMKSSFEPEEGNKVKLSVTVDSEEFEHEVEAAFKRIAREVRIPGFRPGKAPRALIEARIGTEAARGDALEFSIPRCYEKALIEHDIDVIAPPEFDITGGREEGDVTFEAVVEVRPVVNVGGYESLRVTIDSIEVTDEELDAQVDRLRERFGTLEEVDRPVLTGDHLTLDVAGARDGEPLEGLVAEDYLYEVGSGTIVPEMDENLAGTKAGDVIEFTADHPDPDEDPIDFTVTVKEVKERVLPEADDAWAAEASEFETLEELRADLAERMSGVKRAQAQMQVDQKTQEALAALVTEEIPDRLVDITFQNQIQNMAQRLQAQGLSLDDYIASMGESQEKFIEDLREQASEGAKVDLALRAIATAEELEPTDEDIEAEYERIAEAVGEKLPKVRRQIERNGQVSAVRSDVRRRMTVEWLVDRVELVDESGASIDRSFLTPGEGVEANEDDAPTEDDE